ncbi:response regulator [Wukongibacter sp. M2B1]|uniref:response regulator n=1 Tax=Wukongibacter sp. M2B1 TaxID=3088895 RepID=UPI003D7A2576
MIKVAIVDDQILLSKSLKYLLEQDEEIKVVDIGTDGEDVISICRTHRPDVMLLDIKMPGMNGIEGLKLIKNKYPNTKVLMLTTFEDSSNIIDSFIAGTDGYVVKDIAPEELVIAVKCIQSGLKVMHKSVNELIVKEFLMKKENRIDISTEDIKVDFSKTEIDIIKLIAKGMSNRDISRKLSFAEGTIKNKVSAILQKLDCKDRTQIALFALKNNFF